MKGAGFRKRSNTFNRTAEPGLVHVVNFQMGRFDPPGSAEIPFLRPNLYGSFTVNVGVFIEEALPMEFGASPLSKGWVTEFYCQIRQRLNPPSDESWTGWWSLDESGVAQSIIERLASERLPWFDQLSSRADIVSALESVPPGYEITGAGGPNRLVATRILVAARDMERAQRNFDEWVTVCRARGDADDSHLRFLSAFAEDVGLKMLPA
jgi:hypothetical protein